MIPRSYEATSVFVSGAYPELTFNERLDTGLKKAVLDYLRKGAGKCLLVHGSSKTGKTVLVERWLSEESAIWIRGDEIQEINDLYARIIDELDLFTDVSESTTEAESVGAGAGAGAEVGLPGLKFRLKADAGLESGRGNTRSRNSLSVSVVKTAIRQKPIPIVIDDFHFMDSSLRLAVAKAVKDLVRSTRVVLIAIPHSTFEPLRALPDMDWRVQTLGVKRWERNELAQIAVEGFRHLGIVDHDGHIGLRLADESRGAPAIMQTLCLEYTTEVLQVWKTARPAVDASAPASWDTFLRSVAEGKKPSAFDALLNGKDVRGTDRTKRRLRTGEVTDIYGAVLYTLSDMRAFGTLTKQAVADRMQVLLEDAPPASTISGNLNHLAEIAESVRSHGDPALTYQDPELEILDPFFSFYLAHAKWDLPELRQRAEVVED